jgi:PP-loop superfamily ATP-utilizing enzyme
MKSAVEYSNPYEDVDYNQGDKMFFCEKVGQNVVHPVICQRQIPNFFYETCSPKFAQSKKLRKLAKFRSILAHINIFDSKHCYFCKNLITT